MRRGPDEGAEPGALTLHRRASCVRRENARALRPSRRALFSDAVQSRTFMDLVGRYSNPPYTSGALRELTEMIPDGMVNRATGVAPRQRQHRLRPQELEQLTSDYRSGVAVNDLAARYDIDRHTVIEHMRRQGVPRRYPRPRGMRQTGLGTSLCIGASSERATTSCLCGLTKPSSPLARASCGET